MSRLAQAILRPPILVLAYFACAVSWCSYQLDEAVAWANETVRRRGCS